MTDKNTLETLNYMMADVESQTKATAAIRSLIESGSLYQSATGIGSHWRFAQLIPDSIQAHCPVCDAMQSFSQKLHNIKGREPLEPVLPVDRRTPIRDPALLAPPGAGQAPSVSPSGIYSFMGLCSYCHVTNFIAVLLYDVRKGTVQKVGQNPPPWSKAKNAVLEKALGSRADLFKKANALIAEGYGIGACAYLRRLLEDEIDPLMTRLIDFKKGVGADATEVRELEAIRTGRDFSAKATAVYNVLPEVLKVAGTNPLKTVHSHYSEGLHALSEEDCLEIASDTVAILSHILTYLAERPREQRTYVEKIKQLDESRKRTGGPGAP